MDIIDLLKPICQKVNTDTLHVASTSIDISAKVYGIRVDDIHSDGLKLASSMARVSSKDAPKDAGNMDLKELLWRTNILVTTKQNLHCNEFLSEF